MNKFIFKSKSKKYVSALQFVEIKPREINVLFCKSLIQEENKHQNQYSFQFENGVEI